MKTKTKLLPGLIIAVLLMLPLFTFAQSNDLSVLPDNPAITNAATVSPTNSVSLPGGGAAPVLNASQVGNMLLLILIPVLTPMLVALGKVVVPRCPPWLLPIIAPAFIALVNWLSTMAGGPSVNPLLAVVLGAAGTGFREIADQAKQRIQNGPPLNPPASLLIIGLMICLGGLACAPLNPNANPVIVRVEQFSTAAKGAFELVLNTDNANRGFWITNAPGFHQFAETLRVPTPVNYNGGTTNLPRWSAGLWSLNTVKKDYKAGLASSNALATAQGTVSGMLDEANTWLSFTATNHP